MNKGEKPTETKLARGRVLESELAHVLNRAAEGAEYAYLRYVWRDGHSATTTDLTKIDEAIEDPLNLFSVHGRFDYADKSELALNLQNYRTPGNLSAKGQTARTRQAAIGQMWASIPDRAKLTKSWDYLIWCLSLGLMTWAVINVVLTAFIPVVSDETISVLGWSLRIAGLFLGIGVFLSVRRLTQQRWFARMLLSQHAAHRADAWTVVSAVGTAGALVVAVFAWLYPRH